MPSLIIAVGLEMDRCSRPLFLCALEGIPKWHLEVAKLEGLSSLSKIRQILIPGVRKLALFVAVFLTVDGVASFSGAYAIGGTVGYAGFGTATGHICLSSGFSGGSGRFDLPGAASMSLLVAPIVAAFLYLLLRIRIFLIKA